MIQLYQNLGYPYPDATRQTLIDMADWNGLSEHLALPEQVERFLTNFYRNNPDWQDPDKNEVIGEGGTPK